MSERTHRQMITEATRATETAKAFNEMRVFDVADWSASGDCVGSAFLRRHVDLEVSARWILREQRHSQALADEVASVLVQLDELAATWGDEAVFRRCRDRLRAALKQARGEVTCERNGNNAS